MNSSPPDNADNAGGMGIQPKRSALSYRLQLKGVPPMDCFHSDTFALIETRINYEGVENR